MIEEVSSDIGISGYAHALRDNDIRHIRNSHGEMTNEKYPVTADDLKQIPDIVENYDDVLYVPRSDGKSGIYYVKQHNGVTYYLEAIKSGNTLANKQMIKVETGTIPDIKELKAAINKKWNSSPLRMNNIPRMYVQDVRETVHNNSISQKNTVVNRGNNAATSDMDIDSALSAAMDNATENVRSANENTLKKGESISDNHTQNNVDNPPENQV